MPFRIIRDDISRVAADAIVCSASPLPVVGGGSEAAIHAAAGPGLLRARDRFGRLEPGAAVATKAYGLHAKYVIHTVGPVWRDGKSGEVETLHRCYRNAICTAISMGCKSAAFPLISSGAYGFSKPEALRAALWEFQCFAEEDIDLILVVYDREAYALTTRHSGEVAAYIDDNYVIDHPPRNRGETVLFEEQSIGTLRSFRILDASHAGASLPDFGASRPVKPNAAAHEDKSCDEALSRVLDEGSFDGSKPVEPNSAVEDGDIAGALHAAAPEDESCDEVSSRVFDGSRPVEPNGAVEGGDTAGTLHAAAPEDESCEEVSLRAFGESSASAFGLAEPNGAAAPVDESYDGAPRAAADAGSDGTPERVEGKSPDRTDKPEGKGLFGRLRRAIQGQRVPQTPKAPLDEAEGVSFSFRAMPDLETRMRALDAGFSETLLRLIDESGCTDAEIYKRANISRKLFSKIRSAPDYRPSKPTALAFCVALHMTPAEARELLARAGYAISHSSRMDVIVEYFLETGNYDILEINETLFCYDQPLLGSA